MTESSKRHVCELFIVLGLGLSPAKKKKNDTFPTAAARGVSYISTYIITKSR